MKKYTQYPKLCLKNRYLIIDESRTIQGGIQGFPTKKEAEKTKNRLIAERSKRGQAMYNREFNRSKNLNVVKGQVEVIC